jgi:hypothetical protein
MTASVHQTLIDSIIFHFASDFKDFVEIPSRAIPSIVSESLAFPPEKPVSARLDFASSRVPEENTPLGGRPGDPSGPLKIPPVLLYKIPLRERNTQ